MPTTVPMLIVINIHLLFLKKRVSPSCFLQPLYSSNIKSQPPIITTIRTTSTAAIKREVILPVFAWNLCCAAGLCFCSGKWETYLIGKKVTRCWPTIFVLFLTQKRGLFFCVLITYMLFFRKDHKIHKDSWNKESTFPQFRTQ